MSDSEIKLGIESYLQARKAILELGEKYPQRIGGNDNIIGRIGEFIALRFLEGLGQKPLKILQSSNPGYDLLEGDNQTQVKVITSENKNGKNVRLEKPWTQFLLIELSEHYKPNRIGLLTEAEHKTALDKNPGWSETPIVKLTMLGPKGLIGKYGTVFQECEIEV